MYQLKLRKKLAKLLEQHDMSASELSRQTGIAWQVISDWLAGVHPRNLTQLKKIAEIFRTSIESLCFDTEQQIHPPASPRAYAQNQEPSISINVADKKFEGRYEIIIKKIDK
jgi:transcriptional regulator with XRE-family HTH domain